MDIRDVDDHYSLMEFLRREVHKQWGTRYSKFQDCEFWEMIQEYMEYCPKEFRFSSDLERELDAMPDHFCRRGKKTEYALMITKDKKGKYQITYAHLDNADLDSFSDDKAYESLSEAIKNCKKYLTTRNWKR